MMKTFKYSPSLLVLVALAAGCRDSAVVATEVVAVCEAEDAYAGNSSRLAASVVDTELVNGAPWVLDGFLCEGDEDWFSFTATAGQILETTADFSHAEGDVQLQLLSAQGVGLLISESATDQEHLKYTFIDDGVYYLRVYGGTTASQAAYALSTSLIGDTCEPDVFEQNDGSTSAAPLDVGLHEGLSVCFGESDWFEIDAGQGQVIQVDALYDVEQTEMTLRLHRLMPDGTLRWAGRSQITGTGAALVVQTREVGPYLLEAVRGASTVNANYDLNLDIVGQACLADAQENNDSYSAATPLVDGDLLRGKTLCIGDQDWYQVEVQAGQLIQATASFSQSDVDIAVLLYEQNADGTITYRTGANTLTDNETVMYRPVSSGRFFLYVVPTRGTVSGTYDLELNVLGDVCVDDVAEPNNGYLEASPLDPGALTGLSLCVGDDDWFSLTVEAGQLLTATAAFSQQGQDLGMHIYKKNADGSILYVAGSNTLTDNETVLYRPFDSGEYLIRVYRSRGTSTALYDLTVGVGGQPCVDDDYEFNDSFIDAAPIADGLHEGLSLCVGDTDWYEIQSQNGQIIDLNLNFTHADNDLGMTLYKLNDDGTLSGRVGANSVTDNEYITYRPYDSGTFLAQVYRTRGTQVATYDFDVNVTGTPCVPDAFDQIANNDGVRTASPIVAGDQGSLSLCVADADWYSIEAKNGQLITANILFDHASGDLGIAIYQMRADGTYQYRGGSNTLTDNETAVYRPQVDGTYYIYVYRTRGTAVATYDFNVSLTGSPCVPDAFEVHGSVLNNNDRSQASPIVDGLKTDLTLCVGDTDWYAFDLQNGQQFSAELLFTHADNDLGMRLYRVRDDGTLQYRQGADSLTDNEWILYRPYDTGSFLLNVYRTRGTIQANYTLDTLVNGPGCVADAQEPNNHYLEATPIPSLVDIVNTRCTGDVDYFDLGTYTVDTVIDATATFSHATGNLAMTLYALNPDNTVTALKTVNTLTDNEVATITVGVNHYNKPIIAYVYRVDGGHVIDYTFSYAAN